MRVALFPLVLVCLLFTLSAHSQVLNEGDSIVTIEGDVMVVRFVVDADRYLESTSCRIHLLDTNSEVMASAVATGSSYGRNRQLFEFRLPIGKTRSATEDLTWYRLRYTIGQTTGIVSVSQLLRDHFELRIISSGNVFAGMSYRLRVRAFNPFNDLPAANVQIDAELKLDQKGADDQELKLWANARTDAEGFAILDIVLPLEARLDGDGEIKVTGRKNGLVREAAEELNAQSDDIQIVSMTDKPIYQPSQLLNIRGIVLKGAEAKTVLAGSEIEFRIQDEDDTLLYREKVTSSEFGIVSISWRIPANAKLGDYQISMRDADGEQVGGHRVKVSRYDLPNFAVKAKPSKPYYLPTDKEAEIEIRADYLFGKPVTKGRVRVVEETSREWNWKEQKYDIDEGEVREGETDAQGRFLARFDLSETHEDLKDDESDKYEDIKLAAYFTDLSTNKTEQRRFDIRVSREPIHVYLIRGENLGNSRLPMSAYVSTFYADGTPAECDVEIRAREEDEDKFKTVGRIKTNAFGAGKIVMPRPKIGDPDDDLDFRLIARDKSGRRGIHEQNIYFDDDDEGLSLSTARSIFKPGEPIDVRIESTVKTGTVYIDVVNGWSVIDSRFGTLKDGRAAIRIPYNAQFKGELKISAYIQNPEDDDKTISSTRGIIFPAKQGINVAASFDKAVYKPNDEAALHFGISDVAGNALESALGVVILDKSVEERARTDAEFGGMFRGLAGWLGYGSGFGEINVKDLNELDLTKPISNELQLVAEVILHDSYYYPNIYSSRRYYDEAASVYGPSITRQFEPLATALKETYNGRNYLHPVDDSSLRSILKNRNIEFDEMRDPWGTAYKVEFSVEKSRDIVRIVTAGPDKRFDTKDDFTAYTTGFDYFTPMGKTIDTALRNYHARTGSFIRDEKSLFAERGIRELLDRYGRSYKLIFDGEGRYLQLRLRSAGPDGNFEKSDWGGDDFYIWTSQIDFFASVEMRITDIQRSLKRAPMNEAQFKETLKAQGLDFDQLRDGNDRPLFVLVRQTSRFWNKVTIETVRNFADKKTTERRVITPVTQQIIEFTIKGVGRDGKPGTYDDVTFTQLVHVLSEQSSEDPAPVPVMKPISYRSNTGSIAGVVTDANGAAIPAATVTSKNDSTGVTRSVTTNDSGNYLIAGLPAGTYSVIVEGSGGFQRHVTENVSVSANATATVNIQLSAAGVNMTVEVTASADSIQTTNSSVATTVTTSQIAGLPINASDALRLIALQPGVAAKRPGETDTEQTSTPRLREYFPETLYWQPEIVTDAYGRAEVKFRMADNITTWKMYTIASTRNGRIGFAEKEVTAFQSFFVDLDPPKFLTAGDEIFLPTQVRNYTEKKQNVKVTMARSDWFSFLNAEAREIAVGAGETENAVFGFKAVMPINDGKQRVTAIAESNSDAIERPVTVRPDGREVVHTESRYLTGPEKFEVNFPANALPESNSAEIKIYPNLMAHVAESVEGLLRRPYGCGEQTISSTYPNVMILKFGGGTGKPRRISESVERKALKFVQGGYERLIGYQVADGGFSYWGGKDSADLALTAYALRFLSDASQFIVVEPEVVKKAEDWLIKQQRADGSWNKKYSWETTEDSKRARSTTTYVARAVAMIKARSTASGASATVTERTAVRPELDTALAKALSYLKTRNTEIDDPYSLALLGLAALDAGDETFARSVAHRLATLVKDEAGSAYWNLEYNTAFNGWGTTGRVEATALVTQLFIRLKTDRELVGKAMIFLLKNKDRYGVWHSTQTTINVLDAFVTSIAADDRNAPQQIQIFLNGQAIRSIEIATDKLDQIVVQLDGKLSGEKNTVEIRGVEGAPLMAQLVARHYVDWRDADSSGRNVNGSRALRLEYKCDRTDAAVMQEISCAVEAERIGYKGYGMLLAEIGTPPGADVSRESLEAAMQNDWSISRYDILPDRIVLYMWSKPGGTKFDFTFRPRYGINAQTPASTVFDYYNPEAQATVAPLRFMAK